MALCYNNLFTNPKMFSWLALISVIAILVIMPAVAEEKQSDNMKILIDKLKADKKLIVAENMELTESEAKDFWPVYDAYQTDLNAINQRIINLITSYAGQYPLTDITEEKALNLITELTAIEQTEGGLQSAYVPKLRKVLPLKKVARYLQIENKIRAAVKYELAAGIPMIP
jgi:hypothetical protein